MYDLLTYSLKAAFVLALLYVPYSLLLRKERFFRLNRLMLLLILTLSLLLPLCNISLPAVSEPAIQAFEQQKETIETLFVMHTADQTESTQQIQTAINEEQSPFDKMLYWVAIVNLAGIAFMFLLRLWQFINMERLIRCGALWKDKQDGGITIYCHSDNVKPCSWMRSIVISEQDYANHRHEILLHEKGHIIHHHSLDILLLTFVQLTQWWNPFIYMLSASLRDVHEYEADNYVLRQGVSMYEYQSLLLKTAVGSSSYAFANSFNHSLTKKRITMMKEQKTSPWMRCKSLYILPLSLVALCAFATPEETVSLEKITPPKKAATTTPAFVQTTAEQKAEPIAAVAATPASAPVAEPDAKKDEQSDYYPKIKSLDDALLVWNGQVVTAKELKKKIKKADNTPTAFVINPNLKEEIRKIGGLKVMYFADKNTGKGMSFVAQLYNNGKTPNGAVVVTDRVLDNMASFDEKFQAAVGFLPEKDALGCSTTVTISETEGARVVSPSIIPGTFTIDGTVSEGLRDVAYLVHIADEDGDIREKPSAVILVKDGKFSYSTQLEKPTTIRIRAVFEDGSICPDWIENKYLPNTTANITVMNGTYIMNTRPNN